MRNLKLKFKNLPVLLCILHSAFCILTVNAQSTRQEFPTPVTTNEISGKIPARDIGDARLTSYFYAFNGVQGDVFVNVQTSNLNGDIDISTADTQKSLTKITIYADISQDETGRVIYLRKAEKLLLRIQGRSPNDDPATFTIKFAGSFGPLTTAAETSAPEIPEVKAENQSSIRVNSVGTIIEVKPKPLPPTKEVITKTENAKIKKPKTAKTKVSKSVKTDKNPGASDNESQNGTAQVSNTNQPKENSSTGETSNKNDVEVNQSVTETPVSTGNAVKNAVSDKSSEANSESKETQNKDNGETAEKPAEKVISPETETAPASKAKTGKASRIKTKKAVTPKPSVPDPLESIKLIVQLKDGTKIEYQMSEVLRFNIIKGILTISKKDGKIERYSLLDVEKTVIE